MAGVSGLELAGSIHWPPVESTRNKSQDKSMVFSLGMGRDTAATGYIESSEEELFWR